MASHRPPITRVSPRTASARISRPLRSGRSSGRERCHASQFSGRENARPNRNFSWRSPRGRNARCSVCPSEATIRAVMSQQAPRSRKLRTTGELTESPSDRSKCAATPPRDSCDSWRDSCCRRKVPSTAPNVHAHFSAPLSPFHHLPMSPPRGCDVVDRQMMFAMRWRDEGSVHAMPRDGPAMFSAANTKTARIRRSMTG